MQGFVKGQLANRMIGIVVIGRNEGTRLQLCLKSTEPDKHQVVYVDSGSTDASVTIARKIEAEVVELDMSIPFTAARARNAGFERLNEIEPDIQFVQFVDGDCELIDGWLEDAQEFLEEKEEVAIACGRLKERTPENSTYNTLCDIEWDVSAGEASECGGIFMIKADIFNQLGGFRATLIAGEEPELCVRIIAAGYSIHRLEHEMAWHDANMVRFSQWWKRMVRSGHAYAEGAWIHGNAPAQHWCREVHSNWFWGSSFLVLLMISLMWLPVAWLLFIYPLQMIRIYRHSYLHRSPKDRWIFAFFCMLAKLPMMFGQLKFHLNRIVGSRSQIIEYK